VTPRIIACLHEFVPLYWRPSQLPHLLSSGSQSLESHGLDKSKAKLELEQCEAKSGLGTSAAKHKLGRSQANHGLDTSHSRRPQGAGQMGGVCSSNPNCLLGSSISRILDFRGMTIANLVAAYRLSGYGDKFCRRLRTMYLRRLIPASCNKARRSRVRAGQFPMAKLSTSF
jgi:hypothetical protein